MLMNKAFSITEIVQFKCLMLIRMEKFAIYFESIEFYGNLKSVELFFQDYVLCVQQSMPLNITNP